MDSQPVLEQFLNQIKLMNEIVHPSILKLWESYEDDKRYYLVSEYCSGRELYDKIIQKDFKFADNEIASIL